MHDLIVIGAGPGGYEAAAHAGQMGKRVAVVEKRRVGGACLNVGCIPTKTFLKASKLLFECRNAAKYGIRASEAQLDMPALLARKARIVGTLTRGVETLLNRSGVEAIAGHARLASRNTVNVDGRVLETKNILIATGSRPAVPPVPGIDSSRVLDSSSALELDHVPERLAIIGAGYIGLEFASFFAEAGSKVTVLEMLEETTAAGDAEISKRLTDAIRRSGVDLRFSAAVRRIDGNKIYAGDSELTADYILNATGRVPVVEDLGLDKVGVDYDRKGIRTSDRGKTNIPGVWACGDVTGRKLLAHAATREGIVAVNNMFGQPDRIRYRGIPAVIYTHPEVASVGYSEMELEALGIEYRKSTAPMGVAGRFLIEHEGGSGFVKALVGARYGNVLGVHAIGDGASEFIMAAAFMIETEMRVSDVRELVFPHPTIGEALKEAIVRAG
ncbi:MAG: dihydrolipoyl dehydrogenase [Bryobacteraceae bacterium]|nr:dihydrolipoyl dehydrogenase [Bryobacteraceae bacterium]